MMQTICGLDCDQCGWRDSCKGCAATNGHPFGEQCMIAECCGKHECRGSCFSGGPCSLRQPIIDEFNSLGIRDMEDVTALNVLPGSFINLEYSLPNGESFKLWRDDAVYFGNQLPKKNSDRCYGLTADKDHLLVCEYGENGADPEIVVYKRRGE